jgi:Ca-activated chloride channel family protein
MGRALAIVMLAAAPVLAQQPAFKSGVELVRIPVHVTGGGQPVQLAAADFRLTEGGAPQTITVFERESVPLSVCILLDVSASMRTSTAPALAAAAVRETTALLTPADEIAILTFASTSRVLVPWMAPGQAARLPLSVTVAGETSLFDATRAGLEMLQTARNPNPVLLLISDGGETSSKVRIEHVVKSRRQSEAQIYAFMITAGLPRPVIAEQSPMSATAPQSGGIVRPRASEARSGSALRMLIGDAGGTIYPFQNADGPRRAAEALVSELRNQYTLGYTPTRAFDGKYRRVKVEIKKRGFKIRHRGGYLALPSAQDPSPKPQAP